MPRKRRPRRMQNEKAGCYTDADGYKRSHKEGLRPSPSHWPTIARWTSYTIEGEGIGEGLIMRSVRERWAVDEEMKRRCLEVVKGLLDHEDVEIQLGAIRAVCSMEKMNLDSELKKQESHKSSFQQYLQMNIQPAAPDYEYLAWKQQKLVDEAREQARREAIANGELDAQAIEHEQAGAATAAMIEKKKSGQLAPLGYFAREAVAKRQNG